MLLVQYYAGGACEMARVQLCRNLLYRQLLFMSGRQAVLAQRPIEFEGTENIPQLFENALSLQRDFSCASGFRVWL